LEQAAFIDVGDSGITRVRRLLPYTRYNIDIIVSSISNPLWVPKAYDFSTITDPDIYKPIDVPFYATGVLDGSVLMQTGNKLEAVPGIEIHVQSVNDKYHKDIRVFADGSFYEMGVPPGKYIAYVDSTQLNVLGASCDPPIRSFDVRITAEGDYVEGMKFLLKKQQVEKSIPATKESIKTQNIVTIAAPEQKHEIAAIAAPEQKHEIATHEKPEYFKIQISSWDTERRARDEAEKFEQNLKINPIVEKVIVKGKSKYAVRIGVCTYEKPKGFKIHISTWDTEQRARIEAKKFKQGLEIKTMVEEIVVNGKSKYALRIGVFSSEKEVLVILRKFRLTN
jgi:endonuclease YncB( thermonuclease family)